MRRGEVGRGLAGDRSRDLRIRNMCRAVVGTLGILMLVTACGDEQGRAFLGTVAVGDTTRSFVLFVPPESRLGSAAPLLLAFHGGGSTGSAMRAVAGLDRLADEDGFLVAYPDAVDGTWVPADTAFVTALVDSLASAFPIDRARVYGAGLSQGGVFVHRLACRLPARIAAVASVAAPMEASVGETCAPAEAVAVLVMMGTADQVFPFEGDDVVLGADSTAGLWAGLNGCGEPVESPTADLVITRWASCDEGVEVWLVRVDGGGHRWQIPQSTATVELVVPFLLSQTR